MQTDEGDITCQGGECAVGIFPLGGFFNSPLKGGVIYRNICRSVSILRSSIVMDLAS